jgi:hypothetical protein
MFFFQVFSILFSFVKWIDAQLNESISKSILHYESIWKQLNQNRKLWKSKIYFFQTFPFVYGFGFLNKLAESKFRKFLSHFVLQLFR